MTLYETVRTTIVPDKAASNGCGITRRSRTSVCRLYGLSVRKSAHPEGTLCQLPIVLDLLLTDTKHVLQFVHVAFTSLPE